MQGDYTDTGAIKQLAQFYFFNRNSLVNIPSRGIFPKAPSGLLHEWQE